MVVYFPKNGKSVCVNGIQIKRPGLPMQFPVSIYEKWVQKGLLVKRPQDMDPISPEEMQKQILQAQEAKQPVYAPQPTFDNTPNASGAPVPLGIGENYGKSLSSAADDLMGQSNEYDDLLLAELQKKGVDTASLLKGINSQTSEEKTNQQKLENLVESESQQQQEPQVPATGRGIFSDFNKEPEIGLTYEKALSMIKRNEDGSLKVGKDGQYVLTPGAKPFPKAEICAVVNQKK